MFPTAHGVVSQGGVTKAGGEADHLIRAHPALTDSSSSSRQVGWRFNVVNANLKAVAARVYLGVSGTASPEETVRLWRASDQALLATAVIITPPQGEWAQAQLSAPVILEAGELYALTTRRTSGNSRSVQRISRSSLTYHPNVTFGGYGLYENSDNYPLGIYDASTVLGIVDLVLEA